MFLLRAISKHRQRESDKKLDEALGKVAETKDLFKELQKTLADIQINVAEAENSIRPPAPRDARAETDPTSDDLVDTVPQGRKPPPGRTPPAERK